MMKVTQSYPYYFVLVASGLISLFGLLAGRV
jgi:hypothetical protein